MGQPDSAWRWAQRRRKIFTSPVKDVLSGCVVGAVVGFFRYEAGDPNWRIAVGAAGLGVLCAWLLPKAEAGVYVILRPWILMEELRRDNVDLRTRIETAHSEAKDSTEELLTRLGNLRLRYIELERQFSAQGGRQQLWNAQTALHNEALQIIDGRLGRDYWAQFKDVKQEPMVVPPGFPSDDADRLNLLYMIHGRSEWISKTIDGIRAGTVVPKPPPVVAVSEESQRLGDLRRILLEAAEYVRRLPLATGDSEAAVRMVMVVYEMVPELLTRAFVVPPTQDYNAFLEAEKQKQGDDWNIRNTSALFLERLGERLTEDNLDQGFLMPQSWLQFRQSDPTRNWPANTRKSST